MSTLDADTHTNGHRSGHSTPPLTWPEEGGARVPYQVFSDPDIYAREQEHLFRGPVWNYVGLEAEVAEPGDFKSTFVGDTPVVITRDKEGGLHAFVNRCAHRGALVCREPNGNRATHTCIYHQWSYNLKGELVGVPFKKGIGTIRGYGADFDLSRHGLHKLRVAAYAGLIFATFHDDTEPLATYLGPPMRAWLDTLFNRPIQVLGHTRQWVNANWKLYFENVKDPYHASLLHLFHATFGLYRSSQAGGIILDEHARHDVLHAKPKAEEDLSTYESGLHSYKKGYALADPSVLKGRPEFDGLFIQTIFPCLVVQQIANTLAVRQILPKAPDRFELIFTYFGYQDDDAEMREIRLKQANLVGPAGLISMEDGYAAEIVQQSVAGERRAASFVEMGGTEVGDQESLISETAIRGFWRYYRDSMGFGTAGTTEAAPR